MRWPALLGVCVVVASSCGGRSQLDQFPLDAGGSADVAVDTGPPKQTKSNKLDVLFAVQASFSMVDAQQMITASIPFFLNRLTSPWCVPTADPTSIAIPSNNGACDSGYQLEFPAVKDIHVGIVSSSLGGAGSPDTCVVNGADTTHQDDHGHLLDRTLGKPEGSVAAAKPLDGNGGNFLAWVPTTEHPNVTNEPNAAQLQTDFSALASGVNTEGCGLQAQLESWYRFLVQPDPYDQLVLSGDTPPKVSLAGVDATLLKQRHDFLRPDSIVLIINITDKNDRWSDPLWLGGYGWTSRTQTFPGGPGNGAGPRGTSECDAPVDENNPNATGPNNPDCTSCAFPASKKPVSGKLIGADPNCNACAGSTASCPQKGWYTPASPSASFAAADGLNVRYSSSMRGRYGLDPMWNVQRYVDGLTSPVVPDRDHEVHDANAYASTEKNCANPLFSEELPDGSDTTRSALCNLKPSLRDPSLVYYLVVGGVPWQLLAQDPLNTSLPLKRTLDVADWRRIVGTDPSTYWLAGIDPHMIESIGPRAGLEAPGSTYSLGSDAENGREWNTLTSSGGIDFQFACVFDLLQPLDCTSPDLANACDCVGSATSVPEGPPLCDPNNRTMQVKGKAYPSIRQLRVAMGLKNQGVVASICPRSNTASYWEVLFTRIRGSISQ